MVNLLSQKEKLIQIELNMNELESSIKKVFVIYNNETIDSKETIEQILELSNNTWTRIKDYL